MIVLWQARWIAELIQTQPLTKAFYLNTEGLYVPIGGETCPA